MQQPEAIDEGEELVNPTFEGHVVVSAKGRGASNPRRRPAVADFGVQVGDDLIKVTMDRVKLMEKNKRMFYGGEPGADSRVDNRKHHSSAESYHNIDGTFSPAPKQSANRIKMRQEMFGDRGVNDRIMQPSIR